MFHMDNEQFRRLIQNNAKPAASGNLQASQDGGGKTPMLGSKARSSIPMTPRSVSASSISNDLARQLDEYRAQGSGQPSSKRFRSTAAPKGTKLASGYVDRTALRRSEDGGQSTTSASGEDEDKQKRIQALEEMMKLGQIDRETFLGLRKQLGITGVYDDGLPSKGLDFDLLERARRGDELSIDATNEVEPSTDIKTTDEDLEAALDQKAEEEIAPIQREDKPKKGSMAPPPPLTSLKGEKLSRDEILKRLKASRDTGSTSLDPSSETPPEPSLSTKFKKIGGPEKKRWIEMDENGRRREVLMTSDKDGRPKRKVRWLDKEPPKVTTEPTALKSKGENNGASVLGMEVPADILARETARLAQQQEADDDDDIFAGVGADYNPLGDVEEDDDSDKSGSEEGEHRSRKHQKNGSLLEEVNGQGKPSASDTRGSRNYFPTSALDKDEAERNDKSNPLSSDPTIFAALKRAAALRQAEDHKSSTSDGEATPSSNRDRAFLELQRKREREDAGDMDLGFGDTRFGDDDDEDGPVWEEGEEKKSGPRKRAPKKRKGDKDSVSDVLGVLEGRRKQEAQKRK